LNEPAVTRKTLETIRRIAPADAHRLVEDGEAVLVDTRHPRFYRDAHAAGAISVPFEEIRRSPDHPALRSMPKGQTIVLYCAWPDEYTSARAARRLIDTGYDRDRVMTLLGGIVAWNQAGYPMKWWDE
jgi:rhodanese-related sulfurtransferase